MAITVTNLTSGQKAGSGGSTASITPTANSTVLVTFLAYADSTPAVPAISGCNLSFTQLGTVARTDDSKDVRLTLWRATSASPSTGSITFGAVTSDQCVWIVDEVSNVDVSAPVVQTVTNSGKAVSSLTVTLASFASADNGTYGSFGSYDSDHTATLTVGSGFTEKGTIGFSNRAQAKTEFKDSNDTSVDMSQAAGASDKEIFGIAVELKASGGGSNFFLMF